MDPKLPLLWALDFNVDPMSSVVAQMDSGTWFMCWTKSCLQRATTQRGVRGVPEAVSAACGRACMIFGDASGTAQQTTGLSDYEMIEGVLSRRTPACWCDYRVAESQSGGAGANQPDERGN